MDNISTEIEARRLTAPRPSKHGVKAWAGSLIALGLVAGGVIAGPRLLAPSADQAAVVTPPVVAVSVPLQRNVDTRLQFLGQFSAVDQVELRAQVVVRLHRSASRTATSSTRAISCSRSTRPPTRSSGARLRRSSKAPVRGSILRTAKPCVPAR